MNFIERHASCFKTGIPGCAARTTHLGDSHMLNFGRSPLLMLAGFTLTLVGGAAHASTTPYFAGQTAQLPLDGSAPTLTSNVLAQRAAFEQAVTVLGRNEFEAGSRNFNYTGGTATVASGAPVVKDGNASSADFTLGRYNVTQNLPPVASTGEPDLGHWLEAGSDFSYTFVGAPISAFAFFGTDFSDFAGAFSLEFLSGGTQVYSSGNTIVNPYGNGGLLFFGAVSTTAFDTVVFHIQQQSGSTNPDVFGFDSFVVGRANNTGGTVPEPTSLALAGLALCAAGWARRGKRVA
jgi:hypothetical protein